MYNLRPLPPPSPAEREPVGRENEGREPVVRENGRTKPEIDLLPFSNNDLGTARNALPAPLMNSEPSLFIQ